MLLVLSPVEHAWFRRSRVIAGIARSRSLVVAGTVCCYWRRPWSLVVAAIVRGCYHRPWLLPSLAVAGNCRCRYHGSLLESFVVAAFSHVCLHESYLVGLGFDVRVVHCV